VRQILLVSDVCIDESIALMAPESLAVPPGDSWFTRGQSMARTSRGDAAWTGRMVETFLKRRDTFAKASVETEITDTDETLVGSLPLRVGNWNTSGFRRAVASQGATEDGSPNAGQDGLPAAFDSSRSLSARSRAHSLGVVYPTTSATAIANGTVALDRGRGVSRQLRQCKSKARTHLHRKDATGLPRGASRWFLRACPVETDVRRSS